jgi:Flp pilus assembly protein TadD
MPGRKETDMDEMNALQAWKMFLKGRIAQEQGRNQEAIEAFDIALTYDPDNRHFLNAKSIAYGALDRPDQATATQVAAGYAELAKSCSGEADKPEPWIRGLETLLRDAENAEKTGAAAVVW